MVLKNRVNSWSALFEFYSWFLVLTWSIIIASMLMFGLYQIRQVQREIVQKEARANFSKDQAIRLWATMHGGVYVPVTAETPPNPYLRHVQERDLKTPSGIELTLMNPAYMLRQTMDKYEIRYGIRGHITSLKHFRPETGPDEWEKDALKDFEKGVKEVFDYAEIDGKPYFRFMAPMITKKDCLKCHSHQGYQVGDVRGGVSVSVPMAPYLANQRRQTISYSIAFILLWLSGFLGILLTSRGLKNRILERDRAEEKLRQNKEMLQMVFDGISDPLVMLGKNLDIRLLNKAAYAYYHVGQEEVVGKSCHQAFRGISAKCENCEIPAAVISDQHLMFEREGFMDSSRIEQVVVYPIGEKENEDGAAIIRITDITNEKMLRKQIVQTEKLSSLGFLVSGVAHEINNPNSFISFNIPILKEYLNEIIPIIDDYAKEHEHLELFGMTYPQFREDVLKLLDNIENGSRRINIAVSNLRGISRTKEKTHMDWINVKEVIEKSVSICRSKINRMVKSFEVSIPEEIPLIYTDSEAIETAVINLLINAAQAVDKDNSWIRLKVAFDDSSQNDLIIDISDNGCGIEEKIKNHIFDPFFTTKSPSEGTGLGLTLCHNSIRELGGRIEVDSEAGKGSTFKVILPDNDSKKNEIG